ncbi:alanine racemase [Cyclobacterium marinum]|uniref:Alanine racemase domain protein n=1 Tax=Cyclobacterium marinum (strain ATCC 25205 / DSM 745 / LMG 13164 / NCIMB 1802) TaxID=880070 RepID=G0IYB7_CYCMS|nr:alanine racemase [Cyclobacterium marinum]AEL25652.1 alanine racemase domain protein [Cyclobacterium marinum DSM 745]MBR9775441.1 twin-arginine translocation signal domain-containing protein [Cytophagales bacterium]|tara:strand:+ start:40963 stop:42183 length:1221 start_codon:yes stop_codon:yes gene_type:complete
MKNILNRRKFLQYSGIAGSAALLTGKAFAKPYRPEKEHEIGLSKWELETPSLCLDLDIMEENLKKVHINLQGTGIGVRPHTKTHKCPALAKLQMEAGAVGVCTAKLAESQVMLENGISEVLMTGVNIGKGKIRKAMQLRKAHKGFIQAVDNKQNAQDLQDAAKEAGVVADVVVDLDVIRRSGVPTGLPALELAQLVDQLPNLSFKGILAYDGGAQHIKGFQKRKERTIQTFGPVSETYAMMKKSGLNMEIFSGAGTGTYNMMDDVPGFTDVQVGSYLFMDTQYMAIGSKTNESLYDDFDPALTVLATVINTNHPNRLITDSGAKALTINKPSGQVIGETGFNYNAGSDEYGTVTFESSNKTYKTGDILEVIVPHCDPVVNLYDRIYGIRNGKVAEILPILGRGQSR